MSLLGKADATLAGMSYKAAMANVAPDLKNIYKKEVELQKTFQTDIKEFFDVVNADNNALADELKEATTTAMANLSAGITPDEAGMELFNNHLNGLRERLKTIPRGKEGDLERAKIRGELGRLKNSTDGIETILMDLGTKIENDDFVKDASFNRNAPLLIAISKGEAKREIVNGNLIYSIPNPSGEGEIKMNYSELKDSLVSNDPEVNKNFNAVGSSANTRGKEVGSVWDTERQGIVNEYEKSLSTKKGFAANIFTKQEGLKYTFAEYMQGKGDGTLNMQIWDALKQAGYNVPQDQDGDGKITESDFANKENGIALINSLTDITDPNFDFQTAKLVAAEFYADNIAKKEFSDGNLVRDKADRDKRKTRTTPGPKVDDVEINLLRKNKSTRLFSNDTKYRKNNVLNSLGTDINKRGNIKLAEGEGEMIWDNNAKTYIYKSEDGATQIIPNKESLFKTFYQSQAPVSSSVLQTNWWKSIKDWSGEKQTTETSIKTLRDLNTAGINKETFMKPTKDIISDIKAVLPEGYDVISEYSNWGKKGDRTPFFRSADQFIVTDENGQEVGQFDTNYFKSPDKAIAELNRFFDILSEKDALMLKTEVDTGANTKTSNKIDIDGI
tara:strand:+ start:4064 stop:5908 length:1845 start_codon:yes stop_codon:yes gene_type:complete